MKKSEPNIADFGPSGVNDTAGAGDLEIKRLWLPLKGISVKKKLHRKIVLPYSYNSHAKNIGVL
jgi:hypothetical protein